MLWSQNTEIYSNESNETSHDGQESADRANQGDPVQMGYPPGSAGEGPKNSNCIMVLKTTAGCLPLQLFKYFLY